MPRLRSSTAEAPEDIREALPAVVGMDSDEAAWRPYGMQNKQDLPPLDQIMQSKIGRFNYLRTAVGHRLLELMRDYIMGGDVGFMIRAKDPGVQDVIDRHWKDPWNDWKRHLPQYILDLSQDGELVMPIVVSRGDTLMGKIDPQIIKSTMAEPFHNNKMRSIVVRGGPYVDDVTMRVIALDRDPASPTFLRRIGDVFFWAVNRVSGGTRGVSDLFALNDFIDQLDRFMYARARNAELRNTYNWDVTITGAGEAEIVKFLQAQQKNPLGPGSIRAHNDAVKWDSVRPDTQADDASAEGANLLGYILFGFGIPPTATGIIAAARTALAEQIDLLYKTFSSRADEISNIVTDVFQFVIDQAIISGRLSSDVDTSFKVIKPRIAIRDVQRTGGALARVGQFFTGLEVAQIYSKEEVRAIMDIYLSSLGFEIPDKKEMEFEGEEDTVVPALRSDNGSGRSRRAVPRKSPARAGV